MDSAMRDLEQIQERTHEREARPLALLLVVVTLGLVLAMGLWVGSLGESDAGADDDPLAHLDPSVGLVTEAREASAPAAEALPADERPIHARDLVFPEALVDDERPEVAAAMAMAAAELAHPEPLEEAAAAQAVLPAHVAAGLSAPGLGIAAPEAPPVATLEAALPAALPAAVTASDGAHDLAQAASRDPMVAAALPAPPSTPMAPPGTDGAYTLQVISYESEASAEAFAAGLRTRGHNAFVLRAEVEGRGEVWRVRIGPFDSMGQAQRYRSEFEAAENMNTLIVRRRDPE